MPRLLVIDDEPNVQYSLRKGLESESLQVISAMTAQDGIDSIRRDPPDTVILDVKLPDMSGLDAYVLIRQVEPRLPVIVITAHGTTDTAIEAMKQGAFEYLLKPVDLHQLREVVNRALELNHLSRVPALFDVDANEEGAAISGDRIVGRSVAMNEVFKAIGRIAPQNVTVLILGESGTGKELVARAIYQHSRRSHQPFLSINCAAIPETLLESELFGHERGAFTGAERRRIGKFEQAHEGTLFLDELGDMSPATQSKVLRVLQEQHFERLGGNETIRTDVRLIAATNKNLEELVAQGKFRQDLFYRLNVLTIRLPPLQFRREDIALLLDYFLKRFSRELGKKVQSISPGALRLLLDHPWPGNVRELQNAIKYGLVHSTSEIITPECLPDAIRRPPAPAETLSDTAPATAGDSHGEITPLVRQLLADSHNDIYHEIHTLVDRILLGEVLRHVKGNQVEASERLGVSRNTLRAKMRALGLAVGKQVLNDEASEPAE